MTSHPALPARLDAADVQNRLGIGPRRLFQFLAEGRFPPPDLRVGKTGRRLWDLSDGRGLGAPAAARRRAVATAVPLGGRG